MRCYFLRRGHIVAVEELPGLSDEQAVEKARCLFAARRGVYDLEGFEVWKRTQVVFQHPTPAGLNPANHGWSGSRDS